jgi:2-iminobutanoate/2-iminopropanoate deaminase
MERTKIHTSSAPAAIGPYSQAISCGELVYTSGQIALDPASGELVGDDIEAQTHRVLQNLQAVLSSAGASLSSVIKTTVFLTHMSDFQAMNAIYAGYFEGLAPARSTVAVAELPRKARVEIECIALVEK